MLNKDIKEVLLYLNSERKRGLNNNEIINLIRIKSIELGLTYQELYELFFNKEYLIKEVNNETSAFQNRIEILKKEIDELKVFKREISSIICDLYDHEYTDYKNTNIQTCIVCGRQKFLPDIYKKMSLSKKHQ